MPKTYEELLGFKKMQKISLERLTPPMAPKPIASEQSVEAANTLESMGHVHVCDLPIGTDSTQAIDFNAIANSSEFQRFIYLLLTGKTHRGSAVKLKRDIKNTQENINFVNSYKGVMSEFKAKVERMRKK